MLNWVTLEPNRLLSMKRKRYPRDLTDAQWKRIEPLIPPAKPGGRDRAHAMRDIVDALFYVLRSGCSCWSAAVPAASQLRPTLMWSLFGRCGIPGGLATVRPGNDRKAFSPSAEPSKRRPWCRRLKPSPHITAATLHGLGFGRRWSACQPKRLPTWSLR